MSASGGPTSCGQPVTTTSCAARSWTPSAPASCGSRSPSCPRTSRSCAKRWPGGRGSGRGRRRQRHRPRGARRRCGRDRRLGGGGQPGSRRRPARPRVSDTAAGTRQVRPRADRVPARRWSAHRALQLALRPPPRRHLRAPDRGHRRGALAGRVDPRDPGHDAVARPGLGRGSVPAERPAGPVRRGGGPAAPGRPRLRVLLHAGRGEGAERRGDEGRAPAGLRRPVPQPHRGRAGSAGRRGPAPVDPLPDARTPG